MTPQRRKYDGQEIVVNPDGSMTDLNAGRRWVEQWFTPPPRPEFVRKSRLDPEIAAFEASKRGSRAA